MPGCKEAAGGEKGIESREEKGARSGGQDADLRMRVTNSREAGGISLVVLVLVA